MCIEKRKKLWKERKKDLTRASIVRDGRVRRYTSTERRFRLFTRPVEARIRTHLGIAAHGVNQMLRGIRLFSILLLGPGATLYSPQAVAQELNPSGFAEWDSTNQVLFFDGGSPGLPVRGYTDAHQRGEDINIFKDFPGLQKFYATSLTAGPEGTTFIATILNFGGHNIRRVVLTYDFSAQLLKTWEPAPQYAEVIAYSKDDDAIFVLGDRYVPDGPSDSATKFSE